MTNETRIILVLLSIVLILIAEFCPSRDPAKYYLTCMVSPSGDTNTRFRFISFTVSPKQGKTLNLSEALEDVRQQEIAENPDYTQIVLINLVEMKGIQ